MQEIEFLYLGLRTASGIDCNIYKDRFNEDFKEKFFKPLKQFMDKGFLEENSKGVFLNKKGFLFLDYITSRFVDFV